MILASDSGVEGLMAVLLGLGFMWLILMAVAIVTVVGTAKMFMKMGHPWWKAIIPFYNNYLLCQAVFGNGWLFLLTAIPYVGSVVALYYEWKLCKAFGKDTGFCVLSLFFPFVTRLILGFGDAKFAPQTTQTM